MSTGTTFSIDADEEGLVISVARNDSESWTSFADATADVAEKVGTRWRVPRWAVATITWWFATREARTEQPAISARARRVLNRPARRSTRLAEVLEAPGARWSTWPVEVIGPAGPRTFDSPVDYGFSRQLRPFQREQVARLLRAGDGCNFSVPGSGKTTVAYAVWGALHATGAVARTVVVAPLSAHEAWTDEAVACFEPGHGPTVSLVPQRLRGDVIVFNYETLQDPDQLARLLDWLRAAPSMVVLDEAHRAKAGRLGVRGTAALALADAADFRFVLTGTPAPNGRSDLAAMFDLAWPGSGAALVGDPRNLRCFVRARKSELGLPPQSLEVERVPMSAAHRRLYEGMVDRARSAVADPRLRQDLRRIGKIVMLLLQAATDPAALLDPTVPLSMSGDRPDAELVTLASEAASHVVPAKFVRVRQLVGSNAELGHKTLVWSCFRHHVDALARLLAPFEPAVVVGDVDPGPPRQQQLDRFRHDPCCHVLVATPQTLGEGVSLHHACQRQIHVDRTYNAGLYLQSLDRTHRLGMPPGADSRATVLVSRETIDELVETRLSAKVAALSAMLDDPDLLGVAVPTVDDSLDEAELLLGADASEALADLFELLG